MKRKVNIETSIVRNYDKVAITILEEEIEATGEQDFENQIKILQTGIRKIIEKEFQMINESRILENQKLRK